MRRAAILTTLTVLLLMVTGTTVAQEGSFSPERDYQTEPTAQGATSGETTEPVDEAATEESEPAVEDVVENSEATGTQETTEAHNPEVAEDGTAEGEDSVGNPESIGNPEVLGKPERVGEPQGVGGPEGVGKPVGVGRPESAGKPKGAGQRGGRGKARGTGGQQKVTLVTKARTRSPLEHPQKTPTCVTATASGHVDRDISP